MKILFKEILVLLCSTQIVLTAQQSNKKVICYYNTESYGRAGIAALSAHELKDGITLCTHLVYGYAGFTFNNYEMSMPNGDNEGQIRQITALKKINPNLKIYLSLGGDHYQDGIDNKKYIDFLEGGRLLYQNFIQSSIFHLKTKYFDGLDLAFQFPRNKPRSVDTIFGKVLKVLKNVINPSDSIVDKEADTHKLQFMELVRDLHQEYVKQNLSLSLTVLPNVNSSWYFDIPKIHSKFEYINLFAFDFLTPERNPHEADYTAPIYWKDDKNRLPHYNIEFQVKHWLDNDCPKEKLNLGIPTYGRAWKTTRASGSSGVPVVADTAGPAAQGIHSKIPGLLSWTEVCAKVTSNFTSIPVCSGPNAPSHTRIDTEGNYGNYAFCPADKSNNDAGIWISYDDPRIAGVKAQYVKRMGLGGVALFDMSYDDFRGICTGVKYPILQSVKTNL